MSEKKIIESTDIDSPSADDKKEGKKVKVVPDFVGSDFNDGSPDTKDKELCEGKIVTKVDDTGPSCETKRTTTRVKCITTGCEGAAKKGCLFKCCFRCCTDENCIVHRLRREQIKEEDALLKGETEISKAANMQRLLSVPPGTFREPSFEYIGETVVIWNFNRFFANRKMSEKCLKHVRTPLKKHKFSLQSRRKRFNKILDNFYKKSLEENSEGDNPKTNL